MIKVLLIAYGNPLRRDDGAGLALAQKLKQHWQVQGVAVQHIETHQLVPELAAEIAGEHATHIVFVDTAAVDGPALNGSAIDGSAIDASAADGGTEIQLRPLGSEKAAITLGHQCSPDLIVYIAQHLYEVQISAWLVTISGTDFGHGVGFSVNVEELLKRSDWVAAKLSHQLALSQLANN